MTKTIIAAAALSIAVLASGTAFAGSKDADRNLTTVEERLSSFGKIYRF